MGVPARRRDNRDVGYRGAAFHVRVGPDADAAILLVGQDISALKRNERTLRGARDAAVEASLTDPLTSLANRRSAMDQLDARFASGQPFHLALVDVDHFKRINDGFSHAAGDAVLTAVARRLQRLEGAGCMVARLAGTNSRWRGRPAGTASGSKACCAALPKPLPRRSRSTATRYGRN